MPSVSSDEVKWKLKYATCLETPSAHCPDVASRSEQTRGHRHMRRLLHASGYEKVGVAAGECFASAVHEAIRIDADVGGPGRQRVSTAWVCGVYEHRVHIGGRGHPRVVGAELPDAIGPHLTARQLLFDAHQHVWISREGRHDDSQRGVSGHGDRVVLRLAHPHDAVVRCPCRLHCHEEDVGPQLVVLRHLQALYAGQARAVGRAIEVRVVHVDAVHEQIRGAVREGQTHPQHVVGRAGSYRVVSQLPGVHLAELRPTARQLDHGVSRRGDHQVVHGAAVAVDADDVAAIAAVVGVRGLDDERIVAEAYREPLIVVGGRSPVDGHVEVGVSHRRRQLDGDLVPGIAVQECVVVESVRDHRPMDWRPFQQCHLSGVVRVHRDSKAAVEGGAVLIDIERLGHEDGGRGVLGVVNGGLLQAPDDIEIHVGRGAGV
eukprot:scaffold1748_cov258-Pinguiococcus_pyrenoidosus.AAC.15